MSVEIAGRPPTRARTAPSATERRAAMRRSSIWAASCTASAASTLTRIDGIDVGVAQTVISEVGLDMSRWQDEDHFASWLGLCPDNAITGRKVLRRGTRHVINRAATALRLGASTLLRSQSYLGAQYR